MVGEVAGEGLLQLADLAAHPAPGQLRQHLGVALPGDQRGHHLPPGDPEQVAGHHRQLDLGVLEQLLGPLLLRGARLDQITAVAGDVAQPADLRRRHQAGSDHLPLGDLAQPHRVELVGLWPTRQVLDVAGVDQPGLESVRLQQVVRRLPVVRGGLHHHPGHAQLGEPVGQPQQRAGHRRVGRHLLQPPTRPALVRHPHAAHQLGLADIQRGHPRDDLLGLMVLFEHTVLLAPHSATSGRPQGPRGIGGNLIRVLEATPKLPRRGPQHPAETRPRRSQTTGVGGRPEPIFSAERAARQGYQVLRRNSGDQARSGRRGR